MMKPDNNKTPTVPRQEAGNSKILAIIMCLIAVLWTGCHTNSNNSQCKYIIHKDNNKLRDLSQKIQQALKTIDARHRIYYEKYNADGIIHYYHVGEYDIGVTLHFFENITEASNGFKRCSTTPGPFHPVKGFGDEATISSQPGVASFSITIRKGNYVLVITGRDEEAGKKNALAILHLIK